MPSFIWKYITLYVLFGFIIQMFILFMTSHIMWPIHGGNGSDRSALGAPSSVKPVCALPLSASPAGLVSPRRTPRESWASRSLHIQHVGLSSLNLELSRAKGGASPCSRVATEQSSALLRNPVYFFPWVLRIEWFLFPKYHISSIRKKNTVFTFSHL